jgi:hypothetical protein
MSLTTARHAAPTLDGDLLAFGDYMVAAAFAVRSIRLSIGTDRAAMHLVRCSELLQAIAEDLVRPHRLKPLLSLGAAMDMVDVDPTQAADVTRHLLADYFRQLDVELTRARTGRLANREMEQLEDRLLALAETATTAGSKHEGLNRWWSV